MRNFVLGPVESVAACGGQSKRQKEGKKAEEELFQPQTGVQSNRPRGTRSLGHKQQLSMAF